MIAVNRNVLTRPFLIAVIVRVDIPSAAMTTAVLVCNYYSVTTFHLIFLLLSKISMNAMKGLTAVNKSVSIVWGRSIAVVMKGLS